MKYHVPKNQKPIKYKEFIQEIQNSSRSSSHDLSLLSQRSFRESNTFRDNMIGNNNKGDKSHNKENKNILINDSPERNDNECQTGKKEYKINQPKQNQSNDKRSQDINDKLYTFCDAKLTQRSVQIRDKENRPLNENINYLQQTFQKNTNISQSQNNEVCTEFYPIQKPILEQKYFRTNKQKTDHKENINFVNSILAKVDYFHQAKQKTQQSSSKYQNQDHKFLKPKQSCHNIVQQIFEVPASNSLYSSQQNTQRKIQSVKKITLKQQVQSCQKNNTMNNQSNQKSREPSFPNIKKKQSQISQQTVQKQNHESKQKQKNVSSKKKIVSLNINSLKSNNAQNYNKIKLKLSMDRSSDKERFCQKNGSQNKQILRQSNNCSMIEGKNLMHGSLVSENTRMGSLEQSKIEVINHDFSNQNLLMSGSSLTDLANILAKQQSMTNIDFNEQIQRLCNVINEQKQRQKQLSRQIYELNQKLKHSKQYDDKKQLQILQKDCYRLTTSYKEIKKLYQSEIQSKAELQSYNQSLLRQNQSLKQEVTVLKDQNSSLKEQNDNLNEEIIGFRDQNSDLKECLKYKESVVKQLQSKVIYLNKNMRQLQHQLNQSNFPSQLQGLSEMIKQKISQYQESINNYEQQNQQYRSQNIQLRDQNEKLLMIREKLQNFTTLLKQEIQEKDSLIDEYESQLRQFTQLRRSIKSEHQNSQMTENKLKLKIKQLQSKLKLANTHIDYLTKEIVDIKHQNRPHNSVKLKQLDYTTSQRYNDSLLQSETVKSTHLTTIANTITTRNSSITHLDMVNKNYPCQQSTNYRDSKINSHNDYDDNNRLTE